MSCAIFHYAFLRELMRVHYESSLIWVRVWQISSRSRHKHALDEQQRDRQLRFRQTYDYCPAEATAEVSLISRSNHKLVIYAVPPRKHQLAVTQSIHLADLSGWESLWLVYFRFAIREVIILFVLISSTICHCWTERKWTLWRQWRAGLVPTMTHPSVLLLNHILRAAKIKTDKQKSTFNLFKKFHPQFEMLFVVPRVATFILRVSRINRFDTCAERARVQLRNLSKHNLRLASWIEFRRRPNDPTSYATEQIFSQPSEHLNHKLNNKYIRMAMIPKPKLLTPSTTQLVVSPGIFIRSARKIRSL